MATEVPVMSPALLVREIPEPIARPGARVFHPRVRHRSNMTEFATKIGGSCVCDCCALEGIP
jgi:hypothetical protein